MDHFNDKPNKKIARVSPVGIFAGLILFLFPKKVKKISDHEAITKDLGRNTRKTGLVFSDKLRDFFRPRWIRKSK